jgi:prepilin-type N-terminal cleavage/methylation domain-containing protein
MMRRTQPGFTLIELMVTVAIAAILLAVTVPSFTDLVARQRVEGAMNELVADLGYAATEAVSRNLNVAVTSTSETSYRIATVDAGGTVLTTLKTVNFGTGLSITTPVTVTYQPFRANANATSFTISSSGTTSTLRANISVAGLVSVCAPSGAWGGNSAC